MREFLKEIGAKIRGKWAKAFKRDEEIKEKAISSINPNIIEEQKKALAQT